MHWADVEAERILERSSKPTVSTGITPSGPIHVGNMREIITGYLIYTALKDKGADARLIYSGDTIDPLRRRYPFLGKDYEKYIGKPLSDIPCPCGSHSSYAEHFLEPFLNSLERLGIKPDVLLSHEEYRKGTFAEAVKIALDNRVRIKRVLEEISGRELPDDWWPYNALCEKCGSLKTEVLSYEYPYVKYRCECGHEGSADIRKGEGKLVWRVEWPAKWYAYGVTCEPFGKDHAAAGGSYDTGSLIAKEIYGIEAPHPVPYEWIELKGKGAMSSSKGVAIAASDILDVIPPEVVVFYIARYQPTRHLEFDPGLGLLGLVDEYDRFERIYYGAEKAELEDKEEDWRRAYELSQTRGIRQKMPVQVSYRHLVNVVQIASDFEAVLKILRRTGEIDELSAEDEEYLRGRVERVRKWLDTFAPDSVKFSITPNVTGDYSEREGNFAKILSQKLSDCEWNGEAIHNAIRESAEEADIPIKKAFKALYRAFIGKEKGPRLGYFLSTMEREFVTLTINEIRAQSWGKSGFRGWDGED